MHLFVPVVVSDAVDEVEVEGASRFLHIHRQAVERLCPLRDGAQLALQKVDCENLVLVTS